MPRFAVILPAAGRSSRFGDSRRKKPFVTLKGRPVWVRAAEAFVNREDVAQTLICISEDDRDFFKQTFQANLAFMNIEIVPGGAERADTVQNALARIKADVDYVAVHDAARPLLAKKWVDDVFNAAVEHGAAIPGIPISSTVKRVEQKAITETVPRDGLWCAQTPQVFDRKLLLEAYAKRDGFVATDEAQLVERIGQKVHVVEGSPLNIKITTQEDLKMVEALVDCVPKEQSLKNLHPFADERFL
ncbi:2-C-methyl-D-erythritol 4-phosphate cytidylyltransferase [Maioricimonas rarisocia]|uniref:2-C-methyl-D-erythritol 4-phosphate cytidylyltransferase n=1 Tax=Maioricimonas rarisocia TaxID=2528026 RepID=A0A517Z9M1_9PLAN|nr:2-C-methyl-D-erythritol 4-phosphate cytidylyltransferase [Maioricimonas rarisocia]QDU39186.1 2-C-methyl-D-erythritol 4-phosphate cytidylyltransferase [Maioricimonas rarisocia]